MFKLPKLPYSYKALEPYIDAQTMKIHHTKHHQGYVNKLNDALKGQKKLMRKSVEELVADWSGVAMEFQPAIRNNGGGHANHSLFWTILTPKKTKPEGKFAEALDKKFSDLATFKENFSQAAATRFGSGWAWLVVTRSKKLKIVSTANQDSPLSKSQTPILGLDVWEHAYYLNYQNRRPDYIKAFWHIVNWPEVGRRYEQALG